MIGDKYCFLPEHTKKSDIIIEKIIELYEQKKRLIISIAGISGCGKSEISLLTQEKLWEKYKIRSKIIHLDDYYKVPPISREEVRKKTNIIGKEEINWKKINKIIEHYRNNERKLYVQRIHKFLDDVERCISPGRKIDCLIIEGLFCGYIEDKDLFVYLDGNTEDTWKFRVMRGKENEHDEFRKYVVQKESNCVVQSKRFADLIIPFNLDDKKTNE